MSYRETENQPKPSSKTPLKDRLRVYWFRTPTFMGTLRCLLAYVGIGALAVPVGVPVLALFLAWLPVLFAAVIAFDLAAAATGYGDSDDRLSQGNGELIGPFVISTILSMAANLIVGGVAQHSGIWAFELFANLCPVGFIFL